MRKHRRLFGQVHKVACNLALGLQDAVMIRCIPLIVFAIRRRLTRIIEEGEWLLSGFILGLYRLVGTVGCVKHIARLSLPLLSLVRRLELDL